MTWKPTATAHEQRLQSLLGFHKIATLSNVKTAGYYPDLIVVGTNVIIEVDGSVHRSKEAKERDRIRTQHLKLAGYQVLRFSNRMIDMQPSKVIERVKKAVQTAKQGRSRLVLSNQPCDDWQKERARARAKMLNQRF